MKKVLPVFVFIIMLTSCGQQGANKENSAAAAFNLDSAKAAITAANNSFAAAVAKGDSTGVAALYTKDACMVQPGTSLCGRAAITSFFSAGFTKMGIKSIKLNTTAVFGGPELVAEEGNYELDGAEGKLLDKGKYTVLWKQEDGKWKLHRDIGLSEMPPPPAEKK